MFRAFALWRYEHLNHSVLLRVGQYYAGMAARWRPGGCHARGLTALGQYTWAYGSVRFRDEAEGYWRDFQVALRELKSVSDAIGAPLVIMVSPLVFDIDRAGRHPYFNHLNLDFSCATIAPRERLGRAAGSLGIPIVDPAPYVREKFEARLAEGNFTRFFFPADTNHFTPVTAGYIAEYLAESLFSRLRSE